MGITGLIPFLDKASRRVNVSEFSGCTVAIDSYCWLHKGAFACADKIVRGENTDIHIKYCLKYVTMLLSKNIKPILIFDGRHLPAKALTETKRRESRDISKKRAAELLSLGKIDEARSYMRRSVDITHAMALSLIKECRQRNVDCIVAPYEADAQLAYLNIRNIAQLVITEDSDLILFGCTKVLFKMDLDGTGTLVETIKLPLVMKCSIEHYKFDKFRQMCIMSGCDYLPSLPGIGLAKARQFVNATQDPNFANALRKLPSYFNRSSLIVTDEYRENFLKAEATFKHQYVYDPLQRVMVRLTEPDDDDIEQALCVNAGELLDPKTAFQLALGNLDPFTLKKVDDWHPDDNCVVNNNAKTSSWVEKGVSNYPSIWREEFKEYLGENCPWQKKVKKVQSIIQAVQMRPRKKVVNLVNKYVPETQDENLTIENLSNMYCVQSTSKKLKMDIDIQESQTCSETQSEHNTALIDDGRIDIISPNEKSPILENKQRSFKKCVRTGKISFLKRLSKFPRTELGENIVASKFFNLSNNCDNNTEANDITVIANDGIIIEESPDKISRNPFKVKSPDNLNQMEINIECSEIPDTQWVDSQKENCSNPIGNQMSPILEASPISNNPFETLLSQAQPTIDLTSSEDSVVENTYPLENLVTPTDSQISFGNSPPKLKLGLNILSSSQSASQPKKFNVLKKKCKVPGLKRTQSLPSNQPTLLSKFGFKKRPVLKK